MQVSNLFSTIFIALFTFIFYFAMVSCDDGNNRKLGLALKQAGTNKEELLRVIDYYQKKPDDSLKLKAAWFLIENMPGSFAYDTSYLGIYRPILFTYDSLLTTDQNYSEDDLKKKLNSLWYKMTSSNNVNENIYHRPVLEDVYNISSVFLIKNIEYAFDVWKTNPYTDSISFKEFCEYILPYRRQQGVCIEEWRSSFNKKHIGKVKDTHPIPIQKLADNILIDYTDFENTFKILPDYPYLKLSDYYISKRGTCATKCWLNSMIFASIGIPVAIDYIPAWGNRNGKHYWNTLIYNGRTLPFESYREEDKWKYKRLYSNISSDSLFGKFRIPKVFRQSYISDSLGPANNPNESPNNIPSFFLDKKKKDVSNEYFTTQDVEITLDQKISKVQYAYLCVFNPYNLIPVQWGKMENKRVVFTDMGMDIVYNPAIYQNGKPIPIGHAFYLNSKGQVISLKPSNRVQTVELTRKYPLYPYKNRWTKALIGGRFQGANRDDFKDACDLYIIEKSPDFFLQRININNKSNFRFMRFLFPEGSMGNLAEMNFFSIRQNQEIELTGTIISSEVKISENIRYAFDNDLATYISPDTIEQGVHIRKPKWVGVDFFESKSVNAISFCPRNDTNNIIVGNSYELFYWNKGWISLGIKEALSNVLKYENVPQNALLVLKCLNGGVEERIFTYENGNQVWL